MLWDVANMWDVANSIDIDAAIYAFAGTFWGCLAVAGLCMILLIVRMEKEG